MRVLVSVAVTAALAACSSADLGYGSNDAGYGRAPAPVPVAALPAVPQPNGLGATVVAAPVTGADGYPNINVDTARPSSLPTRTAAERDRLEAEMLALGARQQAGVDASKPASVIQELQELGRRSKAETERAIESGAAPATP
ncbi:hypothetical protein EYW49_20855 [Siculibacillus lacustris]|uniref:DUF3035 domain-containing protein n=1 Tax=Siculibacillus lacustris TaxID=1549641 RepID=A0A4Q9VE84_9HYPH|nr:hypothetical protein [Siculibacillus lacustris]TBW33067.1 hypothetical protein EYW49_20855 [Siculibacillus lacustris]